MQPSPNPCPIGTPGQPWGEAERAEWLAATRIQRSYQELVVPRVEALRPSFEVARYGALPGDPERYPLFVISTAPPQADKPTVLVTGGVHGYETSGVLGALEFLETRAEAYRHHFNLVVAPCISPWGFETINRWNAAAIDPNRSFHHNSPSPEAAALMRMVAGIEDGILAHIDLHETTDTDETEFRPALAARDGEPFVPGSIPDGFYLVDDAERPQPGFQRAILDTVAAVTHIAPADADGCLIGSPMTQEGVIEYPLRRLGLCAGITDAAYVTTTEVYPDSPRTNPRECNQAQVAAICGALDYLLAR